jgi:uncharacterized protein (TIGR03067 family)
MDKKLPSRPNLLFLKRAAKELLAALAAGDAAAARTFVDHLPAARGLTQEQARNAGFRLADAQSAMARSTGFASWPNLTQYVEQLRALEGSWEFESLEIEGDAIAAAMLGSSRILIDGDRFRTESPGATYDGEFTIDVTVEPHTIDIEFVAGPEAGKWSYGIYQQPGTSTPEHQRLEGEWHAVHLERDGMVMPAAFVKSGRRMGEGTKTVVRFGGQVMIDAETRIDATASPIAIDYRLKDGKVQLGILEWTDDGVRFCFAMPGLPRPTKFVAVTGNTCTLSAWRRI